jgi:hypothetical protein
MRVGHSLLVSSDPVTIQDVSLTLQEFSISADLSSLSAGSPGRVCTEPSQHLHHLNRQQRSAC